MPNYKYIVLDSYPLGNSVVALAKPERLPTHSEACRQWMEDCQAEGTILLVPAIAYYEEVRDLFQRKAVAKIARFQKFCFNPTRFIPLTQEDLTEAGRLWGQLRRAGQATSDPHSLDGYCIIAAQILALNLPPGDFIVATRNAKHLTRFGLPADEWENIAA